MLKTLFVALLLGIAFVLSGYLVGKYSFFGRAYLRNVLFFMVIPCVFVVSYLVFYLILPRPEQTDIVLHEGVSYSRKLWQKGELQAIVHMVKATASNIDLEISMMGREKVDIPAMTSSDALTFYKAELVINGSFFTPFRDNHLLDFYPHSGDPVTPVGQVVSRGVLHGMYEQHWPKLVIDQNGRAQISSDIFNEEKVSSEKIVSLISGRSLLVHKSEVHVEEDSTPYPRTAFGLSENGKVIWFIVVDGKQPGYSHGMPLKDLAEYLVEQGVENAIELDGGGSSTMVMRKKGKGATRLNRPSHTKIPNRERPVVNHVLLYFKVPSS